MADGERWVECPTCGGFGLIERHGAEQEQRDKLQAEVERLGQTILGLETSLAKNKESKRRVEQLLAEARKDTARLDWCDRKGWIGSAWREAIDAAMVAHGDTPTEPAPTEPEAP